MVTAHDERSGLHAAAVVKHRCRQCDRVRPQDGAVPDVDGVERHHAVGEQVRLNDTTTADRSTPLDRD